MQIYLSEIKYTGGEDANFVEVVAPHGTDVSNYHLYYYDKNGGLESVSSLGPHVSTTNGNDVYLAATGTTGFYDLRSDDALALVDDHGNVIQFVSFQGNTVTPTTGPACGMTSTDLGDGSGGGTSLETHDEGHTYFAQSNPNPGVVCFTPGALIDTPDGPCPVESLKVGDQVLTLDNGPQIIRWLSRRKISFDDGPDNAKPVQIKAGAFGQGLPQRDLVISPQHRFVFVDGSGAAKPEVFVAAKALDVLAKIRTMRGRKSAEYIHFALDRHEVIMAEGVLTESC